MNTTYATGAARALFYTFCFAALLDAVTTAGVLVLQGSFEMEANPLARAAFARWGLVPALTARVAIGVLMAWIGIRILLRGYAFFRLPAWRGWRGVSWLWCRGDRWYRARSIAESFTLPLTLAVTLSVVGSNLNFLVTTWTKAGLL